MVCLEDLALLTHSNYYTHDSKANEVEKIFKVEDLGQCEKVISKKRKTVPL